MIHFSIVLALEIWEVYGRVLLIENLAPELRQSMWVGEEKLINKLVIIKLVIINDQNIQRQINIQANQK